jgi:conjugal transfer pilus assembly protein TraK
MLFKSCSRVVQKLFKSCSRVVQVFLVVFIIAGWAIPVSAADDNVKDSEMTVKGETVTSPPTVTSPLSLPSQQVIEEKLRDVQVVSPEVPVTVEMSNRDVNRVTCNEPITDVVYSQEKQVNVKIHQKNAFIKFQIVKKTSPSGEARIYQQNPVEFYIVCGNAVYTIVALPKDIPAKTIQLGSSLAKKVDSNIQLFSGLPTESKIIKLVRLVYQDKIPESFTVKNINQKVDSKYEAIELTLRRHITVEGTGLEVKEYALVNVSSKEIELHERDFVDLTEGKGLAIMIENLKLRPKETSRMIIVLRRLEHEEN